MLILLVVLNEISEMRKVSTITLLLVTGMFILMRRVTLVNKSLAVNVINTMC